MTTYIYLHPDWPKFRWDQDSLLLQLVSIRFKQGRLIGRMEALGFQLRAEAVLTTLTQDVLKSSEIEGEILAKDQVRSSLARRLGIDLEVQIPIDRNVEGVVEMMLDATQNFADPLTEERLFAWHAALFQTGRSNLHKIKVGAWRDDSLGPMRVISGPVGKARIHYQAPPAAQLPSEMASFLEWFNGSDPIEPVVKAALAHLWYVTIHPFDDGNGRIARAIADLTLARSEGSPRRFYSMSAQIRIERSAYYDILERTQRAGLDVTPWIRWFLDCLERAIDGVEEVLANVLRKKRFWEAHAGESFNDRQRKVMNLWLEGFEGKLTSSKWAKLGKCSQDTAHRDIVDLIDRGVLVKDLGGGRSTSYSLADAAES